MAGKDIGEYIDKMERMVKCKLSMYMNLNEKIQLFKNRRTEKYN